MQLLIFVYPRIALKCLEEVRKQAEQMKKEKVELQEEYENVKKETDDLNNVLFLKSSIVERLKAKLGKQTNVNKELSTKIHFILIEAVVQRCSVKKVSLEISQNSQENTCARVSF